MNIKPLFAMAWHQIKEQEVNLSDGIHYEVELFNKFSSGFYKMSVQTDQDQDQTAQTVQSDVGFTLSVNLRDIFLPNI